MTEAEAVGVLRTAVAAYFECLQQEKGADGIDTDDVLEATVTSMKRHAELLLTLTSDDPSFYETFRHAVFNLVTASFVCLLTFDEPDALVATAANPTVKH